MLEMFVSTDACKTVTLPPSGVEDSFQKTVVQ